jgi:hypothetical protein
MGREVGKGFEREPDRGFAALEVDRDSGVVVLVTDEGLHSSVQRLGMGCW